MQFEVTMTYNSCGESESASESEPWLTEPSEKVDHFNDNDDTKQKYPPASSFILSFQLCSMTMAIPNEQKYPFTPSFILLLKLRLITTIMLNIVNNDTHLIPHAYRHSSSVEFNVSPSRLERGGQDGCRSFYRLNFL